MHTLSSATGNHHTAVLPSSLHFLSGRFQIFMAADEPPRGVSRFPNSMRLKCFFFQRVSACRIKESSGWQQVFSSPYLNWTIERIALNAKVVGGPHGDKDKMVAAASESNIILWNIQDGGSGNEIGGRRLTPVWFQCVGSKITSSLVCGVTTIFCC